MSIPRLSHDTDESNLEKIEVTIFVALGDPPDAGLEGTLSLSVLPNTDHWRKVSIIRNLKDMPTVYISYVFT